MTRRDLRQLFSIQGMAQVAPPVVAGVTSIKIGPGRKRSAIVYGVPANLGDAGRCDPERRFRVGVALRHADGTIGACFWYESIEATCVAGSQQGRGDVATRTTMNKTIILPVVVVLAGCQAVSGRARTTSIRSTARCARRSMFVRPTSIVPG